MEKIEVGSGRVECSIENEVESEKREEKNTYESGWRRRESGDFRFMEMNL